MPGEEHPGADDEIGGVSFLLEPGIPRKVAWRLALLQINLGGSIQEVSEAFELGDCDAVRVGVAILNLSGGGRVVFEGSLDKACWHSIPGPFIALNAIGYRAVSVTAVTFRFIRLRYGNVLTPFRSVLSATIVGTRQRR